MSFINKPKVRHPDLPKNELGLTRRDYEGAMSTLCAGCGHDSVTAAIIEAIWELSLRPELLVKLSGIGCSSKTTAYFASGAHGFNGVHGRMPSVATGANAANRDLCYIGVSGDGDSLSIGFGQFAHVIRRNVNMLYMCENNGVYGLTKGQFSASADIGTKSKKGEENLQAPVDPCLAALSLGGTFIARSFSGDKKQLSAMMKAALVHRGMAFLDVISPCVTFNDHEGSTKSYSWLKEHQEPLQEISFIPAFDEISVDYVPGTTVEVRLHDGSRLQLRKLEPDYDPSSRSRAVARLMESGSQEAVLTGVLFVDAKAPDFLTRLGLVDAPLATLPAEMVRPSRAVLDEVNESLR